MNIEYILTNGHTNSLYHSFHVVLHIKVCMPKSQQRYFQTMCANTLDIENYQKSGVVYIWTVYMYLAAEL